MVQVDCCFGKANDQRLSRHHRWYEHRSLRLQGSNGRFDATLHWLHTYHSTYHVIMTSTGNVTWWGSLAVTGRVDYCIQQHTTKHLHNFLHTGNATYNYILSTQLHRSSQVWPQQNTARFDDVRLTSLDLVSNSQKVKPYHAYLERKTSYYTLARIRFSTTESLLKYCQQKKMYHNPV